jgi:mRNA-degrading endonuclease toxin of MazEF toxin-antitoxin module
MVGMSSFPKRGEIYWIHTPKKKFPCLVVSNNAGNEISTRLIVAPLCPLADEVYPFEVRININGRTGKVLLDQVHAIEKSHLKEKVAIIDEETSKLVDKALRIALNL